MQRPIYIKLSLILIAVLLIGFVVSSITLTEHKARLQPEDQKTFSKSNGLMGLTYRTYENDRLTAMISADKYSIGQRKFWAFSVRPFKDAVLENAFVRIYLNRDEASKTDGDVNMLSFSSDLLNINRHGMSNSDSKGLVTRGVIKGLVMEIHESEGPSILIKAKKAYVDAGKKMLKMVNVSMEDASTGKLIKSRSVKWNNKENNFEIAGKYSVSTKDGTSDGEKIKVDLDFNITPLNYTHS